MTAPALTVVVNLPRSVFLLSLNYTANPCPLHYPDNCKASLFKPTAKLPGWLALRFLISRCLATVARIVVKVETISFSNIQMTFRTHRVFGREL